MRNGLLAQEAAAPITPSETHSAADTITLEEAALIMADSGELVGSIRRDLLESERMIQLSAALESIAEVARNIKAATPNELRLLELAGEIVVAGSEVEPDRIVPAMESYLDGAIALEAADGIVGTAKQIWDSIMTFVRRVWEKIRSFYRTSVVTSKYKKMIADLKTELQRVGEGHPEKTTFSVSGAAHGLMVDMSTASSWEHLSTELKRFEGIDEMVFKTYANGVLERGAETVKAINDFDPKIPAKSAEALKARLMGMHSETSGDGITEPFLGNGKLELQKYDKLGGEDASVALERLRLSGLKYHKAATASTIEGGKDEMHNIPAASHPQMEEILAAADKLLDTVDVFYGHLVGQFDKTAKELEAASNKATTAMGELDKAEFGEKSLDYYRTLLNFNKAFADWSTEPFIPMYQHTLRVVNSLAALVRGSMTCYKVKPT